MHGHRADGIISVRTLDQNINKTADNIPLRKCLEMFPVVTARLPGDCLREAEWCLVWCGSVSPVISGWWWAGSALTSLALHCHRHLTQSAPPQD